MSNLLKIMGCLDMKWWIVIIVAMGIITVVAISKKVVKLAIVMIALTVTVSSIAGLYGSLMNKYNPRIENDKLYITLDGRDMALDRKEIKDVEMINNGLENSILVIKMADGRDEHIEVPSILEKIVVDYLG